MGFFDDVRGNKTSMASSMVQTLLTRAACFGRSTLLIEAYMAPRALTCHQQKRGGRRSCHPKPWYVQRKTSPYFYDITPENKAFIKETIQDRYVEKESPLKDGPWERGEWTRSTFRTGVLAVKIGVIPQWTADGEKILITMLQVLDNHVINYVPPEIFCQYPSFREKWSKRFGMCEVGALSADPYLFSKAYCGKFAKAGVPPKRKLTRFLVTPDAAPQPGTKLTVNHFRVGDYVDCSAKTIGHGFQGVVKRWGFKGGPASHGATKFHRKPGATGGGGDKGGIWKGKKLPGHMGMEWRVLKGLKIWRINTKYNVLYVQGPCVPGPTHCYVRVYDTVLRNRRRELREKENPPPMPTYFPDDSTELPEEMFDAELFQFTNPTLTFAEDEVTTKKKKAK